MMDFILAGGVPGLFVLLFGLLAVAAGALVARGGGEGTSRVLSALTAAVSFSTVCAVASCIRAVYTNVGRMLGEGQIDAPTADIMSRIGYGEALVPAVVGFGLLSVAWLLAAVGARRAL